MTAAKRKKKAAAPEKAPEREPIDILEYVRTWALKNKVPFGADRKLTVGASEIGQCMRKTVYEKTGTQYDDGYVDMNGFALRGNIMEDHFTAPLFRDWCEANGGQLLYSGQANQISLRGEKVPLSATPDGLAINMPRASLQRWGIADIGPSRAFVTEMKSISPRYRKENLPKHQHVPQTLVQLGMIRMATKFKPDGGVIPYMDADDYFDIRMYPVPYDDDIFKKLVRRADSILKMKDPNKAPPEGKMRGGGDCSECPFAKRCLGYIPYLADDDPKALPSAKVKEVEPYALKVSRLEREVEQKKKELSEAEGSLILKLGEVKRNFVQGKGFTVHQKKTASQNRTDAKKLVALLKEKGATDEEIESCRSLTKEGVSLSVELAS